MPTIAWLPIIPDVLLAAAITVIGIRVMLGRNLRGAARRDGSCDLSQDADDLSHGSTARLKRLLIPLTGALVFMGLAAGSGLYFHRLFSFSVCTVYAVAGTAVGGAGFFAMTCRTNLLAIACRNQVERTLSR